MVRAVQPLDQRMLQHKERVIIPASFLQHPNIRKNIERANSGEARKGSSGVNVLYGCDSKIPRSGTSRGPLQRQVSSFVHTSRLMFVEAWMDQ